jgi:AhpD family alkylhydroperoxidase
MKQRLDYEHLAPAGMKALGTVYIYVANSGLPSALIDLVYLRVSQINGCAYCVDTHSRDLMKKEVPPSKLALATVWREAGSVFSDQERAALTWAESLTHVFANACARGRLCHRFKPIQWQLVDLTIAISLMNTYNRIAIGFHRGPAGAA